MEVDSHFQPLVPLFSPKTNGMRLVLLEDQRRSCMRLKFGENPTAKGPVWPEELFSKTRASQSTNARHLSYVQLTLWLQMLIEASERLRVRPPAQVPEARYG